METKPRKRKQARIAIDFDGTIVEHRYPDIGAEVPGAIKWMKAWQEAGAHLILWTMRSGEELQQAVDWCKAHGVEFWAVNEGPGDRSWTNSPKVYAKRYIDDAAFGCPVVVPMSGRPYADWSIIGPLVLSEINEWLNTA